MRQIIALLLQNATKVYFKMRQIFYYKTRQFYYKLQQLLQNASILLQNATVVKSFKVVNFYGEMISLKGT